MGSKMLAYTDNVALRYWKTAQNLSPRHVRWLAYIVIFDLDISHVTGITNTTADAISRLASPAICCPVTPPTTGKKRTSLIPALAQTIVMPLVPSSTTKRITMDGFGTMTASSCRAAKCGLPSLSATPVFFADTGVHGRPGFWKNLAGRHPGACQHKLRRNPLEGPSREEQGKGGDRQRRRLLGVIEYLGGEVVFRIAVPCFQETKWTAGER